MSKARAYCFTKFNIDENTEEFLQGLECRYIIYGYEICPHTGSHHLQGYVYFDCARSFKAVAKLLDCHIAVAKGAPEQNYDYCSKDGNFYERGLRPLSDKAKGANEKQRWIDAWNAAVAGDFDAIPRDLRIRHYDTFQRIHKDHRPAPSLEPITEFRPWQKKLFDEIAGPVDPRKIIWYYDPVGSKGKSRFTTHMIINKLATCIPSDGLPKDIALLIDRPRCVIFDYCRDTLHTNVQYAFMEALKDGRCFSPKYHSTYEFFPQPHVIVFSNMMPDETKFSADRWDIRIDF